MHALSIRQPFAELIARGTKTIEYRSWRVNHRGPLLVVASRAPHAAGWDDAGFGLSDVPYGVSVCVVDLVDIQEGEDGFEWHLANPRRVKPVPLRGSAALYHVADERIEYLEPDPASGDDPGQTKRRPPEPSIPVPGPVPPARVLVTGPRDRAPLLAGLVREAAGDRATVIEVDTVAGLQLKANPEEHDFVLIDEAWSRPPAHELQRQLVEMRRFPAARVLRTSLEEYGSDLGGSREHAPAADLVRTLRRTLGVRGEDAAELRRRATKRSRAVAQVLSTLDGPRLSELEDKLGLKARLRIDDRRMALAEEYRTNLELLLTHLTKPELVNVLEGLWRVGRREYVLKPVARITKEMLEVGIVQLLVDDVIPDILERVSGGPEVEGADDESPTHRSPEYRAAFFADLAKDEERARQPRRDYQEEALRAILGRLREQGGKPKLLHIATGGGKTRVANDAVAAWLEDRGGPVYWVTKDWRLLHQAAMDLCRRHGLAASIARLGGEGTVLHPLPHDASAAVVYTTVQTMLKRLEEGAFKGSGRPSLVVWDECHWGEHAAVGRILTVCKESSIPVLGLTATPVKSTRYEIAFTKSFQDLVDERYLAAPAFEAPVATGVRWTPRMNATGTDFSPASLKELAENEARNRLIVDHFASQAGRFGKTIVFACNVDHADALTKAFQKRGVAARALHSYEDEATNRRHLEGFRTGAVTVLVNVAMLTHGIDVPDTRTVFLCRPTASEILYVQMVGRGARRDEASGKTAFHVVEFADDLQEHREVLAKNVFLGASGTSPPVGPVLPKPPAPVLPPAIVHDTFDRGQPTWTPADARVAPAVRGIWYREGQSMRVMFPLVGDARELDVDAGFAQATATALQARFDALFPERQQTRAPHTANAAWSVTVTTAGLVQVRTPHLVGPSGLQELAEGALALLAAGPELGLRMTPRHGVRVELGWAAPTLDRARRAIALASILEPTLATMVHPASIVRFNGMRFDPTAPSVSCASVSQTYPAELFGPSTTLDDVLAAGDRAGDAMFALRRAGTGAGVSVTSDALGGVGDPTRLLPWISLWSQLLWAADGDEPVVPALRNRPVVPRDELEPLTARYFPAFQLPEQQALLARWRARQGEVRALWSFYPSLQGWAPLAPSAELV